MESQTLRDYSIVLLSPTNQTYKTCVLGADRTDAKTQIEKTLSKSEFENWSIISLDGQAVTD